MKSLSALCFSVLLCLYYQSYAEDAGDDGGYSSVRIIEPERDEQIQRPGEFSVIAETRPNLKPGDRMQLFLDGEAHRIPNTEGRFSVSSVSSGPHTLQVKIIDQGAGVLESSAVRRISVE